MAGYGLFRRLWLTRFSQPAGERPIYGHVLRTAPKRVIEVGLGTLARTERLLRIVRTQHPGAAVHYVGLDRFEARQADEPPGVTLKEAHRRLHSLGRVQLVPGSVDTSLSRLCNHLGLFDLVLIAADNDPRHLERSWFFIRRITTPETTVFVETPAAGGWTTIPRSRVDELAAKAVLKRAA
jgi:hypothetical protein